MKSIIASCLLLAALPVAGQDHLVAITQPDLSQKTGIAPAFFGPDAFQVPDMLDGTVTKSLSLDIAGGYADGHLVKGGTDRTGDIYLHLNVPLWSDRATLSAWWSVLEWYSMSPDVMAARRIGSGISDTGRESGAAYISLDMELLREKEKSPSVSARICLRTASEDAAFASARSYDAAGYFFDVSAGKSFGKVRLAASTGFLCWQTDNGRQNDAVMFGVLAAYSKGIIKASAQYGGYWGWERYGDFPRVVKIRTDIIGEGKINPFATLQYGFNDWPFLQLRAGVRIRLLPAEVRKSVK